MAETESTANIPLEFAEELFKPFSWTMHPRLNANFKCLNDEHKSSSGKRQKQTHPTDAVFWYDDPYKNCRVLLLTDFKSYAADTITTHKVRSALKSLAITIECAKTSQEWRDRYLTEPDKPFEVRGLLFVHNHDHKAENQFHKSVAEVNQSTLPLQAGQYLHLIGPEEIKLLYTIGRDIQDLIVKKQLTKKYSFFYPDLVRVRRWGALIGQPGTIEALLAPYFVLIDKKGTTQNYVVYCNRAYKRDEDYEYLLDSMSRFRMLEEGSTVQLRMLAPNLESDAESRFLRAKERYGARWGLGPERKQGMADISMKRVVGMVPNVTAAATGWREHEDVE